MLFTHDSLILVAFLEIDLVTTYFPDGGAWWIENFSYHIYLAKCEILLWVKEFLKVELGFYPFKIL